MTWLTRFFKIFVLFYTSFCWSQCNPKMTPFTVNTVNAHLTERDRTTCEPQLTCACALKIVCVAAISPSFVYIDGACAISVVYMWSLHFGLAVIAGNVSRTADLRTARAPPGHGATLSYSIWHDPRGERYHSERLPVHTWLSLIAAVGRGSDGVERERVGPGGMNCQHDLRRAHQTLFQEQGRRGGQSPPLPRERQDI